MTATALSDLLRGVKPPDGVEPVRPAPVEQTDEYREAMAAIRESRLRKAGLYGAYAEADSEIGALVLERAERGRGSYLWGPCGTGKTYAAAHAVRAFALSGRRARLVTTTALLDGIKDGFDRGGDHGALERAERCDLLALDDLGAERATGWALETLTRLIDTRTARGLPTVVTSNYRLGELRDMWGGVTGQRIASRVAGACDIANIGGEDRRLERFRHPSGDADVSH